MTKENEQKMSIDDKLFKVKFVASESCHLNVDPEVCSKCEEKTCIF